MRQRCTHRRVNLFGRHDLYFIERDAPMDEVVAWLKQNLDRGWAVFGSMVQINDARDADLCYLAWV